MIRFEPESIVRWLDDLDCVAGALRLRLKGRPRRRAYALPSLLLATVLLLGPSVGI